MQSLVGDNLNFAPGRRRVLNIFVYFICFHTRGYATMNKIQQPYSGKYYFLVQERRKNVCLKKYKFDL